MVFTNNRAVLSRRSRLSRTPEGKVDLTDVLTVGYLLASFKDQTIELNLHDVAACKRMGIDRASLRLIDDTEYEIDTLRQALGV